LNQNSSSELIDVVPPEWHRLTARWHDDGSSFPDRGALALVSVDGGRGLQLAPDEAPQVRDSEDDGSWVAFALRSAHTQAATISPAGAPYLLVVRVVAGGDDDRDEFRRWLDEEHARLQVSLPGVNWYLGYEQSVGDHSFLNVWSIDDPEIVASEAWSRRRDTAWWSRLSHVQANSDRGVFRRRS
jgi:hypothetical protein